MTGLRPNSEKIKMARLEEISVEEKQKILMSFIRECLDGARRIVKSKRVDVPSEFKFLDYSRDCESLYEFGKRRGYLSLDEYERIRKEWTEIRKGFYRQKSEKEFYKSFASRKEGDKFLKKIFG